MSQVSVKDVARVVLEDRPDAFVELLAHVLNIAPEHIPQVRPRIENIHDQLHQTLVDQLRKMLQDRQLDLAILTDPEAGPQALAEVKQHLLNDLLQKEPTSLSPLPLTPELREWALRQHTEEEVVAGLREARQQNGPELQEAVRRLQEEWQGRERANP